MRQETTTPAVRPRDNSIDVLRGLVMCLMVLDHVRDYSTSTPYNPTSPSQTTALLFFTRWITHFCAPVFMLLAGAGVGLAEARGRTRRESVSFLVSRGLWLVVLELTVLRLGWMFDLSYGFNVAQVIWALGWCMVFLGLLLPLGPRVVVAIGLVLIVGHNATDGVKPEQLGAGAWLWKLLHTGGRISLDESHILYLAYPLVPWVGVMAIGYGLGRVWRDLAPGTLMRIGAGLIVAFVILRGWGGYGDPKLELPQPTALRTLFAYLDCQKYPPSLDYLLMTVGPALVVLGLLRRWPLDGSASRILLSFGRAPLFFYLLHVPLVHGMTLPFRALQHLPLAAGPFRHGLDLPLWSVYLMWILALAILYAPTRRWAELKRARSDWWLSYL